MRRRLASLLVVPLVVGSCSSSPDEPIVSATTTTVGAPASVEESGCCDGVELAAGRYALPGFWRTPLSVEIGSGWRVNFENAAVLFALVQGQNEVQDPSRWLYFLRSPAGLGPDDVIAAMTSMPELTLTAEPAAVTAAGFDAVAFDAVATEDPAQPAVPANGIEAGAARLSALADTGYFTTGFQATTATRGSSLRFIALDVGTDRTMLVLLDAPADEFDAFAAEADAVLASLTP